MADAVGDSSSELLARFGEWYDGFRFAAGAERVFNPFSTLKALYSKEFGAFWAETGTPDLLVRVMARSHIGLGEIDNVWVPRAALATLDPAGIEALPLLLQAGYLTIVEAADQAFRVGFPNREVREGFLTHLLHAEATVPERQMATRASRLAGALDQGDLDAAMREMQAVFANIPYPLDDATEKRYHSIFQAILTLACCPPGGVVGEVPTSVGRADVIADLPRVTWVFELKRDAGTSAALRQADAGGYAGLWRGRTGSDDVGKPVRVVAVTFGSRERNITEWAEALPTT